MNGMQEHGAHHVRGVPSIGGSSIAARAIVLDMCREWWHHVCQERQPSRSSLVTYWAWALQCDSGKRRSPFVWALMKVALTNGGRSIGPMHTQPTCP